MTFYYKKLLFTTVLLLGCTSYVLALVSRQDPYAVISTVPYRGCPIMYVPSTEPFAGLYYQAGEDTWTNGQWTLLHMLSLYNDLVLGLSTSLKTDQYGRHSITPSLASGAVGRCLFTSKQCTTLRVFTDLLDLDPQPRCAPGDYTMTTGEYWCNPQDECMMALEGEEEGDSSWLCDSTGFNSTDNVVVKTACLDEYLPEGLKYGYNFVAGKYVYVVGNRSPTAYIEGAVFRVLQLETPEDGSEVTVYPLDAQYYHHSVVKVSVFIPENEHRFVEFPVVRDIYHSFKIKLETSCGKTAGSRRVNIIQMRTGRYTTSDNTEVMARHVDVAPGRPSLVYLGLLNDPQIFSQIIDPVHGTVAAHRIDSVSKTSFKAYLDNFPGQVAVTQARLGFIAIDMPKAQLVAGFFGVNISVILQTSSTGTQISGTADLTSYKLNGPLIVIADSNKSTSVLPTQLALDSTGDYTVNFALHQPCSATDAVTADAATLSFARHHDPENAVRTIEDHEWFNTLPVSQCPVLYVPPMFNEASGLYSTVDFAHYTFTPSDKKAYTLDATSDGLFDLKLNGVKIDTTGRCALCVLNDVMCSKLTVYNRSCDGVHFQASPGYWIPEIKYDSDRRLQYGVRHTTGSFSLNFRSRIIRRSDGSMNLKCMTGTSTSRWMFRDEYMDYVCENPIYPNGAQYGLNVVNGEDVYVLGTRQMVSGPNYRLFSVETPANAKHMTVYPITKPWKYVSTKVMAYGSDCSERQCTTIPYVYDVSPTSFRLTVERGACFTAQAYGVRVNVLQVKGGQYDSAGHVLAAGRFWYSAGALPYVYQLYDTSAVTFPNTPILFTQIMKVTSSPSTKWLHTWTSNISPDSFNCGISSTSEQVVSTFMGQITWIGLSGKTSALVTGHQLFGSNMEYYTTISSDTNKGSTISVVHADNGKPGYVDSPFVFSEATNENAYAGLRSGDSSSADLYIGGVDCPSVGAESVKVQTLVVGEYVKQMIMEDVRWAESRPGCPRPIRFGLGAGKYWPRYTSGGDSTQFNGRPYGDYQSGDNILHWADHGWQSCPAVATTCADDPDADTVSCPTSDAYCEAIDVMDDHTNEYSMRFNATSRGEFVGDNSKSIILTSNRTRTAEITAFDNKILTKYIEADHVRCIRDEYPRKPNGRTTIDLKDVYSVGVEDFSEGPGTSFTPYFDYVARSDDVTYYKYFQMNVTDAERTGDGLYVHVKGVEWTAPTCIFSSVVDGQAPMQPSFKYPTSNSFRIKLQMPSCAPHLARPQRVNVLLIKAGDKVSLDGSMKMSAQVQAMKFNEAASFAFTAQIPISQTAVFLSLNNIDSVDNIFIVPRMYQKTASSVMAKIELESGLSHGGGGDLAMLAITMSREVWGFRVGPSQLHRLAISTDATKPKTDHSLLDVDISSLGFRDEVQPFVLVQHTTSTGTDPAAIHVKYTNAKQFGVMLLEDHCGTQNHSAESWNALVISLTER
eukprot:Lankesteria_metandrocarpae@DN4973_c0_g1_i1.p1